ncbi:MAG: helix-turn-helix transcriptional regulator [Candidatus Methylomirabilales bacterium]
MPGRSPSDDPSLPSGGLPRNFLRPCVLLLLKEGATYGYDLLEQLREFGFHRGDPGFLYRTLRSMQTEGLVRSWWQVSDLGPPRRTYEPTEEGEEWLHAWAGALRESLRQLTRFSKRYSDASQVRRAPG